MIALPALVFVATQPINLHLSFDRLAGIVREQFGGDPHQDAVFLFHNRRRTHVKVLWHDRRGYCVFYKRLDRGTYRIPAAVPADATHVRATRRELMLILDGLEPRALRDAQRAAASV